MLQLELTEPSVVNYLKARYVSEKNRLLGFSCSPPFDLYIQLWPLDPLTLEHMMCTEGVFSEDKMHDLRK